MAEEHVDGSVMHEQKHVPLTQQGPGLRSPEQESGFLKKIGTILCTYSNLLRYGADDPL